MTCLNEVRIQRIEELGLELGYYPALYWRGSGARVRTALHASVTMLVERWTPSLEKARLPCQSQSSAACVPSYSNHTMKAERSSRDVGKIPFYTCPWLKPVTCSCRVGPLKAETLVRATKIRYGWAAGASGITESHGRIAKPTIHRNHEETFMPESYSLAGRHYWRSGPSQEPVFSEQTRISLICRYGFADRNHEDVAPGSTPPLFQRFAMTREKAPARPPPVSLSRGAYPSTPSCRYERNGIAAGDPGRGLRGIRRGFQGMLQGVIPYNLPR